MAQAGLSVFTAGFAESDVEDERHLSARWWEVWGYFLADVADV